MSKPVEIATTAAEQKEVYAALDEDGRKRWSELYETFGIFTSEELVLIKDVKKTYWFETYEGESK